MALTTEELGESICMSIWFHLLSILLIFQQSRPEFFRVTDEVKLGSWLGSKEATLTQEDWKGWNIMQFCAAYGTANCLKQILEHFDNQKDFDDELQDALSIAIQYGRLELVDLFKVYGEDGDESEEGEKSEEVGELENKQGEEKEPKPKKQFLLDDDLAVYFASMIASAKTNVIEQWIQEIEFIDFSTILCQAMNYLWKNFPGVLGSLLDTIPNATDFSQKVYDSRLTL